MGKVKNKKNSQADALRGKKDVKNKKTLNPFEVHVNKEKFIILGRKNKNDRGLPGVARSKALKKRKNTLGQEFRIKDKTNKFVDRRIGERNMNMTADDRVTARFTAERIKQHTAKKANIYNLADEEVLTHRGQTLEEIEKFDDPRSEDGFSDNEDGRPLGKLEADFVSDAHFGGGLFKKSDQDGVKSRKDLIDQLIADSKKRKIEKQKVRDATIEMTQKLDTEWKDLLPLVSKSSNKAAETPKPELNAKPKPDDYDKVMRELKFEARGTPSDRLQTEDEVAKEEKEKLEKLENDRLSRMHGLSEQNDKKNKHRSADDLDDGFDLDSNPDLTLTYDQDGNPIQMPNDDPENNDEMIINDETQDTEMAEGEDKSDDSSEDEDSFDDLKSDDENSDIETNHDTEDRGISVNPNSNILVISDKIEVTDNENTLSKAFESINEFENLKNRQISESEDVKVECLNISEKEMTKQIVSQNENIVDNGIHNVISSKSGIENDYPTKNSEADIENIRKDLRARKEIMEKAAKELPYTFSLPSNDDDLQELLFKYPPDYQSAILERMIKCNHPRLAQGNKDKLGMLLAYLLQYINNTFDDQITLSGLQNSFTILDRLMPFVYDLCQLDPENAHKCFVELIKQKQSEYRVLRKQYPGLDTLVFLKLISVLFPTSDFRHQVVTPSLVFISQMLSQCRVKNRADISKGLFLVTLCCEYTVISKRFLPAALNFLCGILHMAIPKNTVQLIKIIPPFKPIGDSANLLVLRQPIKTLPDSCECILESSDLVTNTIDDSFKLRALYSTVKLLSELYENLKVLPAVQALMEPHLRMMDLLPMDNYPREVRDLFEKTKLQIHSCSEIPIEYIALAKQKPKALRMYEPTFEKVYDGKMHKVTSKAKAERDKLQHKYKREMKGTIREIRRDNAYLAALAIKKQIHSDNERKEKVRKIYSEASMQQGELNALSRSKK